MSFQNTINTGLKSFQEATDWYPDSLTVSQSGHSRMQALNDSLQETFFHPISKGSSPIEIVPVIKTISHNELMTSVILLLMVFMVVLWFVMPKRRNLFQQMKQSFKSPGEIASQTPGFLFSFFFYLNYLIVIILYIILVFEQFIRFDKNDAMLLRIIIPVSVAFIVYSLYKLVVIALGGFLFKTNALARQQIRLYINFDIKIGFLLLPILLLMVAAPWDYFFYFGVFIILIANAIKWFQTIAIGKTNSMFKLYHLIIYLCTLEILPVLLLLKLISNLSS